MHAVHNPIRMHAYTNRALSFILTRESHVSALRFLKLNLLPNHRVHPTNKTSAAPPSRIHLYPRNARGRTRADPKEMRIGIRWKKKFHRHMHARSCACTCTRPSRSGMEQLHSRGRRTGSSVVGWWGEMRLSPRCEPRGAQLKRFTGLIRPQSLMKI